MCSKTSQRVQDPTLPTGDEAKQEDSRKKQFQGDLAGVVVIPDPVISLFGF